MTDDQWYYAENDEQQGPVSLAEMRRLVSENRIHPDDLVWCEGMDDWSPAGEIAALREVKSKPKPARKAGAPPATSSNSEPTSREVKSPAAKTQPKLAEQPAADQTEASEGEYNSPVKKSHAPRSHEPMVEEETAEASLAGASSGSLEADEDWDSDELARAEAALFARPKFPARPPRGYQRESRREPEILREITHEVVVVGNGDAQLSSGARIAQIALWALCALGVASLAVLAIAEKYLTNVGEMLLPITVAGYVFCRAAQRCLELLTTNKGR